MTEEIIKGIFMFAIILPIFIGFIWISIFTTSAICYVVMDKISKIIERNIK